MHRGNVAVKRFTIGAANRQPFLSRTFAELGVIVWNMQG
jgi:hypothetical protein